MAELVSKLNGNDLTMFLFLTIIGVLGGGIGVIALVLHHWHRVRVTEMEIALKQQMLDKGMSAAEIVQVIKASKEATAEEAEGGKDFAAVRSNLVQSLAEQEMPAADIELILQALQERPDDGNEKAKMIANLAEQGLTGADIARVVRAMHQPSDKSSDAGPVVASVLGAARSGSA